MFTTDVSALEAKVLANKVCQEAAWLGLPAVFLTVDGDRDGDLSRPGFQDFVGIFQGYLILLPGALQAFGQRPTHEYFDQFAAVLRRCAEIRVRVALLCRQFSCVNEQLFARRIPF